jgi:integrase
MRLLLTDRFCDRVKAAEAQIDYFDETVSGLALRVGRGRKSWTLHYTRDGTRARLTFGTYPAISLATARRKAIEAKGEIAEGRSPTPVAPDTLQAICEEYFGREGSRLRSRGSQEDVLGRLVYPTLGARPITDIRRTEIIRLLDRIEDENGPVQADRTLAMIRRIMNWHASRSDEFLSPIVRGMARTKPNERARERVLTDDELRAIWKATELTPHTQPPVAGSFPVTNTGQGSNTTSVSARVFASLVRFILLTATRRGEAGGAKRSEIVGAEWTIPASRYKTKHDHVVPLSSAACATIPAGSDWLFTLNGAAPIGGYSQPKAALDEASGVTGWTLHDLRRTARSLMSRAGVSSDHAERCLGHVIGGVRGTYDRHEYFDEKAKAFEALAAQIERIVRPQENVVTMGRKR